MRSLAAITLLLLLAAAPAPVLGGDWYYTKEGDPLHWHELEVPYWIDDSGLNDLDGVREYEIIRDAIEQWNSLDTPLEFVYMGKKETEWFFNEENPELNENHIVFVHYGWTGQTQGDDQTAIALTTITYNQADGEIVDTDLRINNDHYIFVDCDAAGPDEQSHKGLFFVILHEAGHMAGLAHSDDLLSVMAPQDANCEDEPPHKLLPDDKEIFEEWYGSAEYAELCMPPEPEPDMVWEGETASVPDGPEVVEGAEDDPDVSPDCCGCATGSGDRSAAPLLLIVCLLFITAILRHRVTVGS